MTKMNMADCSDSNTNTVSTAKAPSQYYTNHTESEKDRQRHRVGWAVKYLEWQKVGEASPKRGSHMLHHLLKISSCCVPELKE